MKKLNQLFLIAGLVAVSMTVSCNKNETTIGTPVDIQIADVASSANGRTWYNGDQVKALFDNTMTTLTNKSADAEPALFKGVVKSETYSLVKAFYPAACFVAKGEGTTAQVSIPQSQEPQLTGADARADFWMATPLENLTIVGDETLSMEFHRASAILKLVLTDPDGNFSGKPVKSVSIDTKTQPITGSTIIDLSANGGLKCEGDCMATAKYSTSDFRINGENSALFALAPVTFADDDVITVMVSFADETQSIEIECGKVGLTALKAGEVTSVNVDVVKTFFKGSGTEEDPWLVSNFAELNSLQALVADEKSSGTFSTGYYKQTEDIVIPDGMSFAPIGSAELPFNGNYDGNGKCISGLNITDVENAALFGLVGKFEEGQGSKVEIKNVVVDGLAFEGKETDGHAAIIGAIAKGGEVILSNCSVKNSTIEGASCVAAIVAKIAGKATVDGCSVLNSGIFGSASNIGGIAGVINTAEAVAIKNCVVGSKCEVNGAKGQVGGILGFVGKGYVEAYVLVDNCAVYGIVRGGTQIIGGIVGGASADLTSGEVVKAGGLTVIANCLFQGKEISTAYTSDANAFMGGIVGLSSRTADTAEDAASRGMSVHIINCFTRPEKVIAKVGPNTARWSFGGIAGGMFAGVHIWNCWSDITVDKMELYDGNVAYGSITTQMQPNTTGNAADYCFGLIKLKNSGSGVITAENSEVVTAEQVTNGYLLDKLNGGASAYAGGKAEVSAWVAGNDGCPVISGIPSDPEQK